MNLNEAIDIYARGSEEVKAYGTSDGVTKAWDTRGRKTHSVLVSQGFHYSGKDAGSGLHRYIGKSHTADDTTGKSRTMRHQVFVDPKTGAWAHEYGLHGTSSAIGRGSGPDAKSLDNYIRSGTVVSTKVPKRSGPIWKHLYRTSGSRFFKKTFS